ncbi:Trm112 family protein [Candidatus Nitrosocosmicus sp. T]
MNKKLLDILVCPFDKVSTLELIGFKTNSNAQTDVSHPSSLNDQGAVANDQVYKDNDADSNKNNQQLPNSRSVLSDEIIQEGLLLCRTCMRFYPITEEIPIILPDELRDKKKDIEFLQTWNKSIPEILLKNLKPWTI